MIINTLKLRTLREDKCWSQEHLAKAAGIGLRTLQRVETEGSASFETVMSLAAALDIKSQDITITEQSGAQAESHATVDTASASEKPASKPLGIVLISIYNVLSGLFIMNSSLAVPALFMMSASPSFPTVSPSLSSLTPLLSIPLFLLAIFLLASAYGLWKSQHWALRLTYRLYIFEVILGVILLLPAIPDRTMSIGITILLLVFIAININIIFYIRQFFSRKTDHPSEQAVY